MARFINAEKAKEVADTYANSGNYVVTFIDYTCISCKEIHRRYIMIESLGKGDIEYVDHWCSDPECWEELYDKQLSDIDRKNPKQETVRDSIRKEILGYH